MWFKLKEMGCSQISFPTDVMPGTKIRPLVLIQTPVLQFLFNLKLSKSQELLKGGTCQAPLSPGSLPEATEATRLQAEPPYRAAVLVWTRGGTERLGR